MAPNDCTIDRETAKMTRMTQTTTADKSRADIDARKFAIEAARVAADTRCENITILELRGLSSVADYFVVATGTSDRQMSATLDRIADFAHGVGRKPFRTADSTSATWMLADYVDVVIHVFDARSREYYDLDGLWGDAPRVEWTAS